ADRSTPYETGPQEEARSASTSSNRMVSARVFAPLACACAIGLASSLPAHAGEPEAAATALFDEGLKLMDQGNYSEACPKLAKSQELAPSGGTLLNLARCYEKNGQHASAWLRYKDAASRASSAKKRDMEKLASEAAK